jgi:uncharacterized protein DUF2800
MNALTPIEPAHVWFGGSSATRNLNCPASRGLIATVPPELQKTSSHAQRGTGLHEATALRLGDDPPALESLIGQEFNQYRLTADDVENYLRPALAYAEARINTPGATYYLEQRVAFPDIPEAFGTADLLVRILNTAEIIDFKYGSGVPVPAVRMDGDTEVINGQPVYYAIAAMHSLPEFFAGVETVILTIVQPVSIDPDASIVSSVEVTVGELDAFKADFRAAYDDALSPSPRLARGPWCRFCPARPICPAHTGPLLDLAQFAAPTLRDTLVASIAAPPDRAAYLQVLAKGLDLLDAVKDLRTALHNQAKAALENGDVVPGFVLTVGRAERHWRDDENTTIAALEGLGLSRDDIVAEELRSVKQIEIRAKARGLKVPQELILSRRSGTSLVRSENAHAPVRGRDELLRDFSAALATLSKGGNHE